MGNSMVMELQSESIFDFHGYNYATAPICVMGAYQCLWHHHIIKEKKKFGKKMFKEIRAHTFGHRITEKNVGKIMFMF